MPALQFGQGVAARVIVKISDPTVLRDEQASPAPAGNGGNKLIGAGQFNIDVQLILQKRQSLKQPGRFGVGFDIHVNRHRAPIVKNGGGTTSQENGTIANHAIPQGNHKGFELALVGFRMHGIQKNKNGETPTS